MQIVRTVAGRGEFFRPRSLSLSRLNFWTCGGGEVVVVCVLDKVPLTFVCLFLAGSQMVSCGPFRSRQLASGAT